MKKYLLKVEVEPLEDGRYFAICPDLQGCHAEGDTIAEALENLEDAARILLELRKEDGLPLPVELLMVRQAHHERDKAGHIPLTLSLSKGAPLIIRAEVLVKVAEP